MGEKRVLFLESHNWKDVETEVFRSIFPDGWRKFMFIKRNNSSICGIESPEISQATSNCNVSPVLFHFTLFMIHLKHTY
jgi:hypothetical protein